MAWVFCHVCTRPLHKRIELHIILPWELPQNHRPSVKAGGWTLAKTIKRGPQISTSNKTPYELILDLGYSSWHVSLTTRPISSWSGTFSHIFIFTQLSSNCRCSDFYIFKRIPVHFGLKRETEMNFLPWTTLVDQQSHHSMNHNQKIFYFERLEPENIWHFF